MRDFIYEFIRDADMDTVLELLRLGPELGSLEVLRLACGRRVEPDWEDLLPETIERLEEYRIDSDLIDSLRRKQTHVWPWARPGIYGLRRCLFSLYSSQTTDFEIKIGAEKMKVHSFVMAARWPFFNRYIKESENVELKTMEIPSFVEKNGMTAEAVRAIIMLCYGYRVHPSVLSVDDCISILDCSQVYGLEHQDGNSAADFGSLQSIALAQFQRRCSRYKPALDLFALADLHKFEGDKLKLCTHVFRSSLLFLLQDPTVAARLSTLPSSVQQKISAMLPRNDSNKAEQSFDEVSGDGLGDAMDDVAFDDDDNAEADMDLGEFHTPNTSSSGDEMLSP
jgi:hypothetical protein